VARRGRSASLQDWIEYSAYRGGEALVRALPERSVQRLAASAARLAFDRGGRRARVALANLRLALPALPEAERRRIARESWVQQAWNAIDALCCTGWSDGELLRRLEVEGLPHARAAAARGRGVLLLMPHLGSIELAWAALPLLGPPVTVLVRPFSNRLVQREHAARRAARGAEILPHRGGALRVLRRLQEGGCAVLVNDQYARRSRGILAPFFGLRCSTSPGAALIALRSRAPVLPLHLVRLAPDRHRLVFRPPLALETGHGHRKDVELATARMNLALEEVIREHPEQWLWGHRRFRHSPDLAGDPYPV
jgi:KDO2-lipid IV(A) lauroyltransferase